MRIAADTIVEGSIRNCRHLDLYGRLDGDVVTDTLHLHEGASLTGRVRADNVDVKGRLEGDVVVRNLIAIHATGIVTGDVRYGRLLLDPGGELEAKLKNVPPHLTGDFSISVERGRHVPVTTLDINAIDPDNAAHELTYEVLNAKGGHIASLAAPATALARFTQADLDGGQIAFVHDGTPGRAATFDVVVKDTAGGVSGRPRTVDVAVVDSPTAVA
jgi:cytoskeletal protein CcmA (bactofilin family)